VISLEIFQQLVSSTNDVIVVMSASPLAPPGPIIVYVNPAFTALTGYRPEETLGQSLRLLHGPNTDPKTVAQVRAAMRELRPIRVELLQYSASNEEFWLDMNIVPLRDAQGRVTHFAAIARDLTSTKRLQEDLSHMASTDALTGLLNRRRFLSEAEIEFRRARRYRRELAVVMLDIDHFKTINDTHGHFTGDQVLTALARHAQALLRDSDRISRWGGEEFALLMPETSLAGAATLAERLRRELSEIAMPSPEGPFRFTVSIGVAARGHKDRNIKYVMRHADTALYAAKRSGRNRVQVLRADDMRAA
jgi:diguanylate cyclase (GGDEF)-like protein/PAS domain S-box-containing protein